MCLGLPGSLPVINREAVRLGIRAAHALNCKVNEIIWFERKNYIYPDLVKGYLSSIVSAEGQTEAAHAAGSAALPANLQKKAAALIDSIKAS